jgi:hypothetical protein
MLDEQLLDLCLSITGRFEGGTPSYQSMVGNFDGAGCSMGILQWNPLSGTLQILVKHIGEAMGWDKAKTFFKSDIQQFSTLSPQAGIQFAKDHYLGAGNPAKMSPEAVVAWKAFLATPESIAAQRALASSTTLAAAHRIAAKFMPEQQNSTRVIAFFFDLATQQGSMKTVPPTPGSSAEALAFARTQDAKCVALWEPILASDPLASALVYYAYERAKLGNVKYLWACLSRRGTIACRVGHCEGTNMDFTKLLD